jgi:hypothetical protein
LLQKEGIHCRLPLAKAERQWILLQKIRIHCLLPLAKAERKQKINDFISKKDLTAF